MSSSSSKGPRFGPGLLVAAAFIGPGTVVTASRAGAEHGCELLWAILLSVFGAIVLQLLAARLGIVNRMGLGEFIRRRLADSVWLRVAIVLVISAIGIGNATYQSGNLTGAATGLSSLLGGTVTTWVVVLTVVTTTLLSIGDFKWLQASLIGLVCLLSVAFLLTVGVSLPSVSDVLSGLRPHVDADNWVLVVALIGTTIVPYNLFLHSSSAAKNWETMELKSALRQARWDTILSIALGGLVTAAILVTASTAFFEQQQKMGDVSQIAQQLQPVLGRFSGIAFALGLFAAGLTSSITAPLATSFAVAGVMGWKPDASSLRFKGVAFAVVGIGALLATVNGGAPGETILFAQLANGLLLPAIAFLLLWAASRKPDSVGEVEGSAVHSASRVELVLGLGVCVAVTLLGMWKVIKVFL